MVIEFEGTTKPAGLEAYDPIEQRHLSIRTPKPVSPEPADADLFCFPVDTVCAIETSKLVFDQFYSIDVHGADGRTDTSLEPGERLELDPSVRFVGLSGPIKLYCRLEDAGTVETGINSIHVTFDEEVTVAMGARSFHERPGATVRTPDDVESMMRAVSALSSALKTTSPERSWPTLRGHPPLIERGPELEIPDVVEPPETDVTVEVPPTYRNLYTISPLSFYLGADVRPGKRPAVRSGAQRHDLGVGSRLEDDVARTLKRLFFLDCLVRTEGLYRLDLHERQQLEAALPFDLEGVYDRPLSERVNRYLDVPYDLIERYVPRWPLTAHVPSTPDGVEILPFVINELGIVREPRGTAVEASTATESDATQLVRSARTHRTPVFTPARSEDPVEMVDPAVTDESIEHAWFGGRVPRGASKATFEAYRSQLSRRSRNESIEILVVCNDARMIDEHDLIDETYGNRENLPFGVRSEFGVTTDEFASLLTESEYDFLHYIGHATSEGLRCPDGDLDVRSLSEIDLGVFFLNACQSYEQGLALARRGAFGGIATVGDIVNEHAVEVGEVIARLLNFGFPLRAALEVTQELSVLGDQYLVVGDGSADIAQSDGGAPAVVEIDRRGPDEFDFALRSYPTKEFKLGSAHASNMRSVEDRHLSPGTTPISRVPKRELLEYLTWTEVPVLIDGNIHWNDGIGPISIG